MINRDAGPAGHGVHFVATGFDQETGTVALQLNNQSLHSAHARVEGSNKEVAKMLDRVPKASPALAAGAARRASAHGRYDKLLKQRGLEPAVARSMGGGFNRLRFGSASGDATSRRRARVEDLRRMREAFKRVGAQQTKVVKIAPDNLPSPIKQKIAERAQQNGASFTPLGSMARTKEIAGMAPSRPRRPQVRNWAGLLGLTA